MKFSELYNSISSRDNAFESTRLLAYDFLEASTTVEKCLIGCMFVVAANEIIRRSQVTLDEEYTNDLIDYFQQVTQVEDIYLYAQCFYQPFVYSIGPVSWVDLNCDEHIASLLKAEDLYLSFNVSIDDLSKKYRHAVNRLLDGDYFDFSEWDQASLKILDEVLPDGHFGSGLFDDFYGNLRFSEPWMVLNKRIHSQFRYP